MKNFSVLKYAILCFAIFSFFSGFAQCTINFLKNPSFELSAQSTLGNNFPVLAPDWTITGGTINLVKTDGSNYFGGPNSASNGTQYLDIVGASATLNQSYTTSCPSTITFKGDFSSREAGGSNWVAKIELVNSSNTVVATSNLRTFTAADADLNPPGADALWYTMSGISGVLPAGTYTYRVTMDDYTNFDNAFLCSSPGCVVPVKVSEFTTNTIDCKPSLTWKVEDEISLNKYEVEKSIDGISFKNIGTVNANGGLMPYTFTEQNLAGKGSFYRLKMIDISGTYKYSHIVQFKNTCNTQSSFEVFPSPVINTINVNYYDTKYLTATAKIINASGMVVKQMQIENGITAIDASNFAKGLYIVTITNASGTKLIKVNRL